MGLLRILEDSLLRCNGVVDVVGAYSLMMFGGVVLAGVVSTIVSTSAPEIEKLTLCVSAFEPVEALVHGL